MSADPSHPAKRTRSQLGSSLVRVRPSSEDPGLRPSALLGCCGTAGDVVSSDECIQLLLHAQLQPLKSSVEVPDRSRVQLEQESLGKKADSATVRL